MIKVKRRFTYTVAYMQYNFSFEKTVSVIAGSKAEAYHKVIDEYNPYCAWVVSVTYANGNYRTFNTCGGDPY